MTKTNSMKILRAIVSSTADHGLREVLEKIGKQSKAKGLDKLTSRQIDKMISQTRRKKSKR